MIPHDEDDLENCECEVCEEDWFAGKTPLSGGEKFIIGMFLFIAGSIAILVMMAG